MSNSVLISGFDAKNSAEKIFQSFGPNSPYENQYNQYTKLYKKVQVDRSMYPIQGKWRGALLRRFTECYSKGESVEDMKTDDSNVDPDGLIRCIPLVALLAGRKELLETLQDSISQLQTNDMIVAVVMAVSRLIERYILNGASESSEGSLNPVEQVVRDLKSPDRVCAGDLDLAMVSHLNKVLQNRAVRHEDASVKFGVS